MRVRDGCLPPRVLFAELLNDSLGDLASELPLGREPVPALLLVDGSQREAVAGYLNGGKWKIVAHL